jgi:hypothetical protein
MSPADPPKRRRIIPTAIILVLVLITGIAALVAFIYTRLGTHPDGSRVTLALASSGTVVTQAGGLLPITLPADLAADGVRLEQHGLHAEAQQNLLFRREKVVLTLLLTAGKQPVDTARLGYTLFDAAGREVGSGVLRPDVHVPAAGIETVHIADPDLNGATRIELRKLP